MILTVLKLFIGTFASRILGFVRMLLMARYFGGRAAMDIFQMAYMLPNLFRRVLGEQAVESSFLPVFKSLTTRKQVRQAWRAASVFLNWLLLALVLAAGICYLFAPQLVAWVLAPGFDAETATETARLGRLMCPFMVLIGLAAFCGSLLLAHGQTLAYSLAPTLFNAGWIAAMMLLHRRLGVYSLGVGVLAGGVLYLAGSALAVVRGRRRGLIGGHCDSSAGLADAAAFRAMRLAGPVCAAALVARCASVVDRAIASFLETGSVAALAYAMQLVLLPFALFGLSVGRAALVPLSEHAGANDVEGFQRSAAGALRLGLVLLIPLTVGTALLAQPLADLLKAGRFRALDAEKTAIALRYYALGIAGMGFVSILSRAMYALKDSARPLWASVRALAVNAILSAALALTPLRHGGIALATSIAMTLQALLLFIGMSQKLRRLGATRGFGSLWKPIGKICLATAVMSAAVLLAAEVRIESSSFGARLLKVLIPGSAGAVVYGLAMLVLDRHAIRQLLRRRPD